MLLKYLSYIMDIIKTYQNCINQVLSNYLENIENESLKEKLEYSLDGGKRLRSMIVYELCSIFNIDNESKNLLILSVEFLHSASLILDDLPSMDNDTYRRNKLTLHKVYGVKHAYITANYLFSEAMKLIWKLHTHQKIKIINYITHQNKNATIGQYYDLFRKQFKLYDENEVIYYSNLKTVPFFMVAFILPYMLSTHENKYMQDYENLACNFSYAFQIVDDFEDEEKDKQKKLNNHILFLGKEKAYQLYTKCLSQFRATLQKLKINSIFFERLINLLEDKMSKYHKHE